MTQYSNTNSISLHSSEDIGCPYFLVLEVVQVRHIHIPQSDLWVRGPSLIRIELCTRYTLHLSFAQCGRTQF